MILALDPSSKVIGWAVLDKTIFWSGGTVELGGTDISERCYEAFYWLDDFLGYYSTITFDAVAIEVPVLHFKNVKTLRTLAYVNGALRAAIIGNELKVVDVMPGKRLTAFGLRANTRRDEAKEKLQELVIERYGNQPEFRDNDIVDAVAVGVAALEMIDEQQRKDQDR
jgi:Holliday junction resolvasome RuvABC endonuclease subunit